MLMLQNSEMFEYINKADSCTAKMKAIASGKRIMINKHPDIISELNTIKSLYKETSTFKMLSAIDNEELIICYTSAENKLPVCLPFIKYIDDKGNIKVAVDVTNHLVIKKDKSSGGESYNIEPRKLYSMLLPAFIYLRAFDANTVLSAEALEISAVMWAKMFTKVLKPLIGLTTNKDRYEAFMALSIEFFGRYYIQAPVASVNNLVAKYMKNKDKSYYDIIKNKIQELEIDAFSGFKAFTTMLFNNEITNVRSIRVANISDQLNTTFYTKKFIDLYSFTAFTSLVSYPYFLFNIIAANTRSYLNSYKAMDDVLVDNKMYGYLLAELLKDL